MPGSITYQFRKIISRRVILKANTKVVKDKKIGEYLLSRCPKCNRAYALGKIMVDQEMQCLNCRKKYKIKILRRLKNENK
jgi:PHP family Zn ribbon phosphoesterase